MVRRRRNDPKWASLEDGEGEGGERGGIDIERVQEDLLLCWGIGPSKVKHPQGVAWEAMEVMEGEEVLSHLRGSRAAAGERGGTGNDNA